MPRPDQGYPPTSGRALTAASSGGTMSMSRGRVALVLVLVVVALVALYLLGSRIDLASQAVGLPSATP
jgi:hypothetical protein